MTRVPTLLRLGQSAPSINVDALDYAVANNLAFGGSSNLQSVAGGAAGGVVLFVPAISGVLTVQGTPTSATITPSWLGSVAVTPFAYTSVATAAALQTTLRSIPAIGAHVSVTGNNGGPYTYTLDSTLYTPDADLITVPLAAVVGGTGVVAATVRGPTACLLYGVGVSADTAGTLVQVELLTVDPGYAVVAAGLCKRRRNLGSLASSVLLETATGALGAPTAANIATAYLLPASNANADQDAQGDLYLEPGTGIRVYATNSAGAFKFAVTLNWLEFATV